MKQWILYCLICSLIYAMAVHAKPKTPVMKGQLYYLDGRSLTVQDCTVFLPYLGSDTSRVIQGLTAKGYYPLVNPLMERFRSIQGDSNGHQVTDFYTELSPRIKGYGPYQMVLIAEGFQNERTKESKHTLKLHFLGNSKKALGQSAKPSFLGGTQYGVSDLPYCRYP